jgi:hypothetical protein
MVHWLHHLSPVAVAAKGIISDGQAGIADILVALNLEAANADGKAVDLSGRCRAAENRAGRTNVI